MGFFDLTLCKPVGFIRTLGVGVGFFNLIPTPEAQLNYFLHRTPKLGILTRAW